MTPDLPQYKKPLDKNILLSIVIPVFNNYNYTVKCLEDLSKLPNDHEIIIVDNGSTDNTRLLKSESANVRIIRNGKNLGFAKACNIGWMQSTGSYVCFLNNDIRVKDFHENWTAPLIAAASMKRALVGPTVGILDNDFNFIAESDKMPTKGHAYMSGWNLTASHNVWMELKLDNGPWCEDYFAFFEDGDLSFRARQKSIELEIVPVPVHHFGHKTANKLNISKLYQDSQKMFRSKWK